MSNEQLQNMRFQQFYRIVDETYRNDLPRLQRTLSHFDTHSAVMARSYPSAAYFEELRLAMRLYWQKATTVAG